MKLNNFIGKAYVEITVINLEETRAFLDVFEIFIISVKYYFIFEII